MARDQQQNQQKLAAQNLKFFFLLKEQNQEHEQIVLDMVPKCGNPDQRITIEGED